MITVSAIIALIGIAAPIYKNHALRAREAVLKQDLNLMRNAISQYTRDKNKAPQSLDDLVGSGYLHAIPKDPFTESTSTWQTAQEDINEPLDQTQTAVTDVHSGSERTGSEGTAYNTW